MYPLCKRSTIIRKVKGIKYVITGPADSPPPQHPVVNSALARLKAIVLVCSLAEGGERKMEMFLSGVTTFKYFAQERMDGLLRVMFKGDEWTNPLV